MRMTKKIPMKSRTVKEENEKRSVRNIPMVKSGMHKSKKMKKEAEEILGVDDNSRRRR